MKYDKTDSKKNEVNILFISLVVYIMKINPKTPTTINMKDSTSAKPVIARPNREPLLSGQYDSALKSDENIRPTPIAQLPKDNEAIAKEIHFIAVTKTIKI